jgi:hypothetical protein
VTETALQALIVRWLEAALPVDSVWHHSPNEGRRHVAFKQRLSTAGTRWGWPDLEIFVPPAGFHVAAHWAPLFLEVKAKKGRTTENQRETQNQLQACACKVAEVRSIREVEAFLGPWVKLRVTGRAGLIRQLEEAAA